MATCPNVIEYPVNAESPPSDRITLILDGIKYGQVLPGRLESTTVEEYADVLASMVKYTVKHHFNKKESN